MREGARFDILANVTELVNQLVPLVGVVLGSAGALLGQRVTVRSESNREQQRVRSTTLAEHRQKIMAYLSATQRAELSLDRRRLGRPPDDSQLDEELHAIWLGVKDIYLACSPALADAAKEYAHSLHNLSRGRTNNLAAKRQHRADFLALARLEIDNL